MGQPPLTLAAVRRTPGLRAVVLVTLLSGSGVTSQLSADELTPPSIDDVIASVKATEQAIETLVVSYDCRSNFNFLKPGTKPPQPDVIEDGAVAMTRTADALWEVHRDGRGRMEVLLLKKNIAFDGTKTTRRQSIVSTFNGTSGTFRETGQVAGASEPREHTRNTPSFMRTHVSPFDLTIHHLGKPISQLLIDGDAKFLQMEKWEDRPVVVLQVSPVTVRPDYIYQQRFWIDLERKGIVRRQSFVQRGQDMPWGLHYQIDAKELVEASLGIWLPTIVHTWNYHVSTEGQDFLFSKERFKIGAWQVNEKIAPARFEADSDSDIEREQGSDMPIPTRAGGL